MSFTLKTAVPWGRSFNEYLLMFSLSEVDLGKRILGCSDGPASFNAELTKKGGKVISIDPIYQFSSSEIQTRINETCDEVIEQTRNNLNEFIWENIKSVEDLGRIRMEAMLIFLDDYQKDRSRYLALELPNLPFNDEEFELALCSHFLFLYSEQFDLEFHIQSITELCRVATEVRIFPLLELGSIKSRHLDLLIENLNQSGLIFDVKKVDYEFQKGGDDMLCITHS